MPEELQSTESQESTKETPVKISQKINWLHIVIGVITGVILLGMGFGVYLLTQSKNESTPTSTKVSTSSAKQATPLAEEATSSARISSPCNQKDEPSDWKIYSSTQERYCLKYPADYKVRSESSDGITLESSDYKWEVTGEHSGVMKKGFILFSNADQLSYPPTQAAPSYTTTLEREAIGKKNVVNTKVDGEKAIKYYDQGAGVGMFVIFFIKESSNRKFWLVQEYPPNLQNFDESLLLKFASTLKTF